MIVKIELWARREGGRSYDVLIPEAETDSAYTETTPEPFLDVIRTYAVKMTEEHRGITVGDVIRFDRYRFMLDRDGCYLRLSDATDDA